MDLAVERYRVFAADARVVVHGDGAVHETAAPDNAYFRGHVVGDPDSRVLLTVRAAGGMRGVVHRAGRYWVLGAGPAAGGPLAGVASRPVDATELAARTGAFDCSTDTIDGTRTATPGARQAARAGTAASSGPPSGHVATVAVETDFEYFQLFGNSQDAVDYVGDLFAHVSALYEDEVATRLEVGSVSLWTSSADPWTQGTSRCGLYEFGRYWNDNRASVGRSLAHFLSGKSTGGIAWVGALCLGAFWADHGGSCPGLSPQLGNYGGDYAFSGGLSGSFDIDNPGVLWDTVVVAHELGHNFSSRHSHCYGGVGGGADPVDACSTGECGNPGCACGPSSLPSGCGGPGEACGTVMSYCHLQSGGFSNVAWTLGTGHPYGVDPGRIPTQMAGYVDQQAVFYPGCLVANTPPTAAGDAHSTPEGTVLTVLSPGVLGNDTDPDGDTLTAEVTAWPGSGSLSLAADGSFTYTPDSGFSGTDTFQYRADDGLAASPAATVTIEVEAPCSGPSEVVLAGQTISGVESHAACNSISVGPAVDVEATGDLTLTAGSVQLNEGFTLVAGGRLTVEN